MGKCRACLDSNKNLFEVDTIFLSNYNSLTNLEVEPLDGLPERFCQTCIEAVKFCIEFRAKCISSESTLREKAPNCKSHVSLQQATEKEVEIVIKNEYKDEDTNDPFHYELVDFDTDVKRETEVGVPGKSSVEKDSSNVTVKRKRKAKAKRWGLKSLSNETTNKQQTKANVSNEYCCGLCDESFILIDTLYAHVDTHRNDKKCSLCSKEFENWPKLLAHRGAHSAKKHCHLCPKRFYSVNNLEQHYLTFHYEEKINEFNCQHCPRKFTCPEKLKDHSDRHNLGCHMCAEIFTHRRLLQIHLKTHEPKKRFACDMCEYTAVYAHVLEHHKKRKHKNYTCKVCDRKFADQSRLKNHICKDKSKLCNICGQHIYESFTRHLISHSNTKPFKCDRCPASYKYRISLKIHMDRHEGIRPYACDYCDRRFFASSTLNKHRRVHTGERPYACETCGKRFTGRSNLKLHLQTHGINLINKRPRPDTDDGPILAHPILSNPIISNPNAPSTLKKDT